MAKPKNPTSKAAQKDDVKEPAMKDVTPEQKPTAQETGKAATPPKSTAAASSPKPEVKKDEKTDKASTSAASAAAASVAARARSSGSTAKTPSAPPSQKEEKKPTTSKEAAKPSGAEPVKKTGSEPPKPPTPPSAAPTPQRSTFWPLVTGGIAAGVIGFIAAEMDAFGLRESNDDLRAALAAQSARLAALEEQGGSAVETPDLGPIEAGIGAATDAISALGARLDALEGQVADVAARPVATETGEVDLSGFEAQLGELQTAVETQLAGVGALQASVEAQKEELQTLLDTARQAEAATADAARMAVVQGALTDISAALTEGAPFADALGTLAENGVSDVPDGLAAAADDGVVTMNALQTRFPDSARAALAVARSSGAQDGETGMVGFLRRSLGARSVAPKEGSDPDAVLSRVEAAIGEGALETALMEADALPDDVQSALGAWLVDARARGAARAALADLSERLTAN